MWHRMGIETHLGTSGDEGSLKGQKSTLGVRKPQRARMNHLHGAASAFPSHCPMGLIPPGEADKPSEAGGTGFQTSQAPNCSHGDPPWPAPALGG